MEKEDLIKSKPNTTYAIEDIDIPIGRADIQEMIRLRLYVDKTAYIARFFRNNGAFYFLNRPRRFGKSLLLDTIDQIAQGNKELFKDYAIGKDPFYEWKQYPVIKLNFSTLSNENVQELKKELKKTLYRIAKAYKVQDELDDPNGPDSLSSYFLDLLICLKELTNADHYEKNNKGENKVIILIDEYDSPFVSFKKEQYDDVLDVLNPFFRNLKDRQSDCKFIFMTGVTKFYLSSLGSGANSTDDISLLQAPYAEILGYTENEIENLFFKGKDAHIKALIAHLKEHSEKGSDYTLESLKQDLKDYYNGYCFYPYGKNKVYNPHSILNFFQDKKFSNYWYNTGNPSILLQQMRANIDRFTVDWDKDVFSIPQKNLEYIAKSAHEIPLLPLMYQTGYLTLDAEQTTPDVYHLKFPNNEVKRALKDQLKELIKEEQQQKGKTKSIEVMDALRNKDWVVFLNYVQHDCISDSSYMWLDGSEHGYQAIFYAFLKGVSLGQPMGINLSKETMTSSGRSDIVIKDLSTNSVYLFKLKINQSTKEALGQIYQKGYAQPYLTDYKVTLIGLNFIYQNKEPKSSSYRGLDSASIIDNALNKQNIRDFKYCKYACSFQEQ